MTTDHVNNVWSMYGLPISPYPSPARIAADLPPLTPERQQHPPEGILAAWLGPACVPESINTTDRSRDTHWMTTIRAFPIPHLIPVAVDAPHPFGVMAALLAALTTHIPGVPWGIAPEIAVSPLLRALHWMGLFRVIIPAPPDLVTNQAMGVELCGNITHINGFARKSEAGQHVLGLFYDFDWKSQDVTRYAGWLTSLTIQIMVARYTNLAWPTMNIPLYDKEGWSVNTVIRAQA